MSYGDRHSRISSGRTACSKRSKTFTGCWTCRSRSVKCGDEKPTCRRCRNSGLECGGYGISLVWPGQKEPKGPQRRLLLDLSLIYKPVLSEQAVSSALEIIDLVQTDIGFNINQFSVFPIGPTVSSSAAEVNLTEEHSLVSTRKIASEERHDWDEAWNASSSQTCLIPMPSKHRVFQQVQDIVRIGCLTNAEEVDPVVSSFNYYTLYVGSRQECQLMHYWITFLSGSLTPTPRPDNAFKDIFTPLAMSAISMQQKSSGYTALLHSLYALVAFSRHNLCSSSATDYELGTKYVEQSLRHLSRSLTTSENEEQLAILATIILLLIVPCYIGESSDWRIHIRGGNTWLQSVDKTTWGQNKTAATLYQVFLCLEALRPAHCVMAKGLEPQRYSLEYPGLALSAYDSEQVYGHGMNWYLDGIYGVTKPIMEAINDINQLVFTGRTAHSEELDQLELKIFRGDPSKLRFTSITQNLEVLTRCHACAFYYACHIYFSCALRHWPPRNVQHLVLQSIEQIEAIDLLEADLNVSGILWPAFITACETEDADLRPRIIQYFEKRENLGCATVRAAKTVILGVWSRRDKSQGNEIVLWHDVMAEMGIDILLG